MGAARQLNLDPRAGRKAPRACAFLSTDLCCQEEVWTGLTMNISEGGLFVATHVILPVGSIVSLHLTVDGMRILTLGQVRWARPYTGDDDIPPGLGLRFVGLDPEAVASIRTYVASAPPYDANDDP